MEDGAPASGRSGWLIPIVLVMISSFAVIIAAGVPYLLERMRQPDAPGVTTAPAPAEPRIFSSVSVLVRNGQGSDVRGADFDVPQARNTSDPGTADIVLGTEDFKMHIPAGGAWLGAFSGDCHRECAANRTRANEISMAELKDGSALCLRTTQQRLVVVRVSELYNEADETRFRLSGTVWAS